MIKAEIYRGRRCEDRNVISSSGESNRKQYVGGVFGS
jgi:hypothetical protein